MPVVVVETVKSSSQVEGGHLFSACQLMAAVIVTGCR